MARFVIDEVLNQPDDFVSYMMNDFLTKHGFSYVEFKGQMVFRAGGGWFEMPKFLVWNYQNGVLHLEAWARYLILPGVYSKEKDLDGFYGIVVKQAYKNDVIQLVQLLHQPVAGAQQTAGGQMQPNPRPVMVQGVDTVRYANFGLGFGIFALAVSWFMGWFGLFFGIMAIIYANKGRTSAKRGRATAGLVCAIIAVVISGLSIFLYAANIFLR